MKIPKELRSALKQARVQQWTVNVTKKGHLAWKSPNGGMVVSPSTPSDSRAVKNVLAMLKKNGLDI